MSRVAGIILLALVFCVGAIIGMILVGSVDCTWMIIDSSGGSIPASMITPEVSTQLLLSGGKNSNLCHLPYGLDVWFEPGSLLATIILIPITIGAFLVVLGRKAVQHLRRTTTSK